MILVQHLRAANDPNGNPQRLWNVIDGQNDRTLYVIDEGYGNLRATMERICLPSYVELPSVNISSADYHARIRAARQRGNLESAE